MTEGKIISAADAAAIGERMREKGTRLVFTNGCFDLLHVGHVRYLEAARSLGDALLVAINGDESVRRLKGSGRPINSENDRAAVVAALETVSYVVIFPELRATNVLRMVAPAVYVKGGDYTIETLNPEERAAIQQINGEVKLLPFVQGYSTSALIERLGCNK